MMPGEQYYQAAVEPLNPDLYMTPTINLICRPNRLKSEVARLESDASVKVTKVYNNRAQPIPERDWR